jgi:hypothetical protein
VTEQAGGAEVDVEVEKPHAHHKTGREWLDISLALSAFCISLVSIFIAFQHGKVMEQLVHQNERLVQANSLPHLRIGSDNIGPDGDNRISLWVENEGVGPAEIRTVEHLFDGKPVRQSFLRDCCGATSASGVVTSDLDGAMLRAGKRIDYFQYRGTPENRAVFERLDGARKAGRLMTRLCYCSVFDECWVRTSQSPRPEPVDACPAPAERTAA